jgi:hypothetical protein
MAELDQEEFKFPDEIKGKPVDTLAEGGDFSLEIEDDTPVADKFAEPPLSKAEVEELEKDNHEDYSKRVKDRIDKMKKAWHDERREKEAALREQQEAINLAKRVMEEHKKLKEAYSSGEKEYISTFQNAADLQLEIAKQAYREAYDSGDSERIVEAQAKLTEASLKQDKAKNFRPAPQVEEETFEQAQQAYQQPAQPQVDPLTARWLEKNSWYGPDEEMTALALGTHTKLEKEFGKGYIGSEEYFKRIDSTMRKRFPENFSEEVEAVDTQAGGDKPSQRAETKSAPVVAPATRSTAAKRIVLKASQVALAKKLGLTPEQYAREMQKLEA